MQTVNDYIKASRILLQDTVADAPRYSDEDFRLALDISFDEAYRIRPDMFISNTIPSFITAAGETAVPAPRGYQSAFLYYITGWVQLQDQEDTQDARAGTLLNKFTAQLLTTAA